MTDSGGVRYELEFEDTFDADVLDTRRWLPYDLPQWCPEFDGTVRVSSLQTGVFAGHEGGRIGQHRFSQDADVRQAQTDKRLYTPQYGRFELRAKATDDPRCMVALWMIGYEDEPHRSADNLYLRDLRPRRATRASFDRDGRAPLRRSGDRRRVRCRACRHRCGRVPC